MTAVCHHCRNRGEVCRPNTSTRGDPRRCERCRQRKVACSLTSEAPSAGTSRLTRDARAAAPTPPIAPTPPAAPAAPEAPPTPATSTTSSHPIEREVIVIDDEDGPPRSNATRIQMVRPRRNPPRPRRRPARILTTPELQGEGLPILVYEEMPPEGWFVNVSRGDGVPRYVHHTDPRYSRFTPPAPPSYRDAFVDRMLESSTPVDETPEYSPPERTTMDLPRSTMPLDQPQQAQPPQAQPPQAQPPQAQPPQAQPPQAQPPREAPPGYSECVANGGDVEPMVVDEPASGEVDRGEGGSGGGRREPGGGQGERESDKRKGKRRRTEVREYFDTEDLRDRRAEGRDVASARFEKIRKVLARTTKEVAKLIDREDEAEFVRSMEELAEMLDEQEEEFRKDNE